VAWPRVPCRFGGRLASAGGLLCRQGLLHGLLEQGLQVCRDARRRDGGRGRRRHRRLGGHGFALLAEGIKVGLPLPGLVEHILNPWHQVLHAAGQLGVGHVPQRVNALAQGAARASWAALRTRGAVVSAPVCAMSA
jgi:hypothetical protein